MATTQGIKLDDETRSRLKSLAKKRDRSPHWIMRTAIEDYLVREEQYELELKEDIRRYELYQLTGRTVDTKSVEKWLTDLSEGKHSPRPQ